MKLNSNSLKAFFIALVSSLTIVACQSNNGEGTSAYIEVKSLRVPSNGGNGEVAIYAGIGTQWSAELVSEGNIASFDIKEPKLTAEGEIKSEFANRLYIYFTRNTSSANRKATLRFSFNGKAAEEVTFTQFSVEEEEKEPVYNWAELPATIENSDYMYITHFTEVDGKEVRNFSMCFDKKSYAARWVAYPYHKIYDNADVGRVDEWKYDPKIPSQWQANLKYSYKGSYDRGHQCASNDRQTTREMNAQTYYYSNMTPQLDTLNQEKWFTAEKLVRNQVCPDTLYVVTGADYDDIIDYSSDASGKPCPVPGAYFKVMLRTKTGVTGKAVSECKADELKAIGFWFEHKYYPALPQPVSVAEIEKRTGFDFFPTVDNKVKETFNASLWSL